MNRLSLKSITQGLLLTAAVCLGACQSHSDGPALWLVEDADTKVYLFGTIHVLKPDLKWQQENFKIALAASDVIYLEADISPEKERELGPVMMDMAMYKDGRTLLDALNDDEEAKLVEVSARFGLPMSTLTPMEPWMAGMTLGMFQVMQSGYSPVSGVESQLLVLANANETPLRYFETAEQQLSIFDDLDEETQVRFLNDTLDNIDTAKEDLDNLVQSWHRGDVKGVAELMNEDLNDEALTQAVLTDRNANWVAALDQLMVDEAGTFFVAVGAGHLAGHDSVIEMLEDKGMTVTRQ